MPTIRTIIALAIGGSLLSVALPHKNVDSAKMSMKPTPMVTAGNC
jgi:hypothetical protein